MDFKNKNIQNNKNMKKYINEAKRMQQLAGILKEGADLSRYDSMSDADLIKWAKQDGMEEFIVIDGEGGLANREELLNGLLGIEDTYTSDEDDAIDSMWDDELDPAGGRGPLSHI
jgi:hypothetical protein